MLVLQTRYQLRMGEAVEIPAAPDTLDFMLHAQTRRVTVDGKDVPGLVVAPNETQDRILLAPSAKAVPGEYAVTLSATSAAGEEMHTSVDVVVKPRATVPNGSTRPPVVLLNGWISGFTNSCPVAASSVTTFGNLAQYLVSDGVPVVYLFDNCLEDPNQPIETLGNDLGAFLRTIKYDDGTQVPQIDLVAHSMGGLIARAYLAGLQPNQTYLPPYYPLVRDLVLIATPNFGSFVAGNYPLEWAVGSQGAELLPGSAFLWNLSTWNQRGDDLAGVNAIAIVGNAGSYGTLSSATALLNASDGLVSTTSASLGFVSKNATTTRIVPYCHVDPAAFTNTLLGTFSCNAPGIANVTSPSHYTSLIVRSFLAGATDWQSVGTAPTADAYLATNGGTFFAMQLRYRLDLGHVGKRGARRRRQYRNHLLHRLRDGDRRLHCHQYFARHDQLRNAGGVGGLFCGDPLQDRRGHRFRHTAVHGGGAGGDIRHGDHAQRAIRLAVQQLQGIRHAGGIVDATDADRNFVVQYGDRGAVTGDAHRIPDPYGEHRRGERRHGHPGGCPVDSVGHSHRSAIRVHGGRSASRTAVFRHRQ
jgi:pimeloyl-ACP methyl ester carboxylesterase